MADSKQIDMAEWRRLLATIERWQDVTPEDSPPWDTLHNLREMLPALLDAYEERTKLLAAIGLQTEEAQGVLDWGGAEGMLRFVTARAAMGDYYTRQAELLQAENEQLGTELAMAKLASEPVYSRRKLQEERDQLRAEVDRLRQNLTQSSVLMMTAEDFFFAEGMCRNRSLEEKLASQVAANREVLE